MANKPITVHLILNAHLDPIWLWPWQSGLDAALATCRSACDRLDHHPDIYFSRGEAWIYDQIERVDPVLFSRIRRHVKSGRWNIVGGWWIQPDCNLPSGFAMKKQIALGKAYFQDRFGIFPKTAYNVDSFGHDAGLPDLMRQAGQTQYVMMRPQEHEMTLPARLFRWRGHAGGKDVLVFRIGGGYNGNEHPIQSVQKSLTELPAGIEHTMCFLGMGDHGGGPTEKLISWCKENQNAIEGCRLVFSTPDHFFDAIAKQAKTLPLVTGELQHHAIGCYSVYRPVKNSVRQAEHLLAQAQIVLKQDPNPEKTAAGNLESAWKTVCFHHFHDTLGGTCILSAYKQVLAELGGAYAIADQIIHHGTRRRLSKLGDHRHQRIVMFNPSERPFDGYISFEPWLEFKSWQAGWRMADEKGKIVPIQVIASEAICGFTGRLLLRIAVKAGGMRVFNLVTGLKTKAARSRVHHAGKSIENDGGTRIDLLSGQLNFGGGRKLALPKIELVDDPTDTWSHGIDRFSDQVIESAQWELALAVDTGPLMASLLSRGQIGDSPLLAEWRVYADENFAELLLRVDWRARNRVLKLTVNSPLPIAHRLDGTMSSSLHRPSNGAERPVRDWTILQLGSTGQIGIACPDVYALDGDEKRVRLTLLRSPLIAHHIPDPGTDPRGTPTDPGIHNFRFRFLYQRKVAPNWMDDQALMQHRPLVTADVTRGMPPSVK